MPPLSIMFKPSSSVCNMQCAYCFYHSLALEREKYSHGLMNIDIFENAIKKAIKFTKGMPINISFQGGEPLLRGIAFYRRIIKIAKLNNIYNSQINYSMQTNGLLINDSWIKLFKENNMLVGISIDGSRVENIYRIDGNNQPTFDRVMHNITLLKNNNVDFNLLIVVTPLVAKNIKNVYKFFTSNNIKHLQFIPCLSPLSGPISEYTPSTTEYTKYLLDLFEEYHKDFMAGNYVSIRHFDNMVLLANSKMAEQCGMNGHCSYQFIIEGDGTVYPCDFFCIDKYELGNIKNHDFYTLSKHPTSVEFIESSILLENKCKKCSYLHVCQGGGCKREKLDIDKCKSHKIFFKHALPHMKKMR